MTDIGRFCVEITVVGADRCHQPHALAVDQLARLPIPKLVEHPVNVRSLGTPLTPEMVVRRLPSTVTDRAGVPPPVLTVLDPHSLFRRHHVSLTDRVVKDRIHVRGVKVKVSVKVKLTSA